MKTTRWTVPLYMALVFTSGAVVGAFAFRLYTVSGVRANAFTRNPEEFRQRYLAVLKTRLQLNDDQAGKIEAIMDDTRKRFKATRDSIEPEIRKIRDDQRQKISEVLSSTQLSEWEKMMEERRRERGGKKGGGRRPGGFPPDGEFGPPPPNR